MREKSDDYQICLTNFITSQPAAHDGRAPPHGVNAAPVPAISPFARLVPSWFVGFIGMSRVPRNRTRLRGGDTADSGRPERGD